MFRETESQEQSFSKKKGLLKMQMTIEEKHLKAVYEAILNKGYSISDFHIAYDEKTGKSVEITRKSQEITQIYKFKNLDNWSQEFRQDLEEHIFG